MVANDWADDARASHAIICLESPRISKTTFKTPKKNLEPPRARAHPLTPTTVFAHARRGARAGRAKADELLLDQGLMPVELPRCE